ncbi:Glutathione S-transferase [Gracilaria domingensis]|nr:Glutathione S-transferase [Gracilaria domingensis]
MSSMKLTYFDFEGRGESIRLAFTISGIEFQDDRIVYSSWKDTVKPTMPYGSVPVITIDSEVMAQSNAILRYVGKLGKLYPTDPLKALQVDEVVDTVNDLAGVLYGYKGGDEDVLKGAMTRYAGAMEKRLAMFGEGPYAVGGQISIADIYVTCFINGTKTGVYPFVGPDVFDEYPLLLGIHKAVMELPSVVAWYEKHPMKEKSS